MGTSPPKDLPPPTISTTITVEAELELPSPICGIQFPPLAVALDLSFAIPFPIPIPTVPIFNFEIAVKCPDVENMNQTYASGGGRVSNLPPDPEDDPLAA